MARDPYFSIVIPTAGQRPKALANALKSVEKSILYLQSTQNINTAHPAEILIGYDGIEIQKVYDLPYARWYKFPFEGHFGNAIRNGLLKAAKGKFIIFLDDDNALTPHALSAYYPQTLKTEIVIGRIDTSRSFSQKYLPQKRQDGEIIVQGNIDPLCLCCKKELVLIRCGGWRSEGGYESDYLNIRYYCRRAQSIKIINQTVGIYDAGRGLDCSGINERQRRVMILQNDKLPDSRPK
ncbi:MAG: glycosyltransferase family 2 protein [Thermodesulfobacteriota bacterium]